MTVKDYIKRNLNLPNALTLLRLFLVPVYVFLFVLGQKYAALLVFLVASLTDMLDGQIARRFNLITDFGKLMDPLADKVMVLTATLSMAIGNPPAIEPVIPWPVVLILLIKEGMMVVGGIVMYKRGIVVYSSLNGKVAHAVFIAGLVAAYFHEAIGRALPDWFLSPDLMLIWLAVVLTLCALGFYVTLSLRKAKSHDHASRQ
jgi:cardiolipin synthase